MIPALVLVQVEMSRKRISLTSRQRRKVSLLACIVHIAGSLPSSSALPILANLGQSWKIAGDFPKLQDLGELAAASPSVLAVCTGSTGGRGAFTARLLVSTDGGQKWTTAATETQQITQMGIPAWLGFETPQVGWWVAGPHSVWGTVDGGRWTVDG